MPVIMNASSKEQQVQVYGSWFTFKPKQIKEMSEEKVFFLATKRAYEGFVQLPDEMSDLDFRSSKEGKQILAEAEAAGIANRVQYLEQLKQNELVSLQRDLDRSNLKYDPRTEISKGMIANFEELASYKTAKQDEAEKRVQHIKELEKILEK